MALGSYRFVFRRHRRASLFFAPNQDALDAGKTYVDTISAFESPAVAAQPLRQHFIVNSAPL
jgi:hypothetical protein